MWQKRNCGFRLHALNLYVLYYSEQRLNQIHGPALPVHRESVMRTQPVLRLHLTCVRLLGPGVTGVNAIKDTPGTAFTAQVS